MNKVFSIFLRTKNINTHTCCNVNTSSVCNNQFLKQSRLMGKFLSRASPAKQNWYRSKVPATYTPPKNITKTAGEHGKSSNRRISVLNKLFMKYVTDLMSTGEIASIIQGRGIEISHVRISPNFNMVNIFWLSRGVPQEVETEIILHKISGLLQHELSQLKIMGVVPKLQFVKDTTYAKIMEVEQRLARADFGEDFVPTDASFFLKSEFILNSQLKPKVLDKIKEVEKNVEIEENPLPPMRHDVFGLDHERIISRITKSIATSKDAWNRDVESTIKPNVKSMLPSSDVIFTSSMEQKTSFLEFLQDRDILKKKAEKAKMKAENDNRVYVEDDQHYDDEFDLSDEYNEKKFNESYNEESFKY